MNTLVEDFKTAREDFIRAVEALPVNRRGELVLGDWNLKDLLSHLNGWWLHQVEVLEKFKQGAEAERPSDVNGFNELSALARRDLSWEEVYKEFIKTGDDLAREYSALSEGDWKRKIWHDRELTPEGFIGIEIKHLRQTHLPQIRSL